MAKTPLKEKIILGSIFGFLVIVSIVILLNSSNIEAADYTELANCLTEKGAVMYGASTCSACNYQKELFGDSFKNIDYIDCLENRNECMAAGIEAYPTWKINGESFQGAREPIALAQMAGCSI